MSESRQRLETPTTVEIQHIGGIDDRTVEFEPGITLLAGQNATNRTSTLQGIAAACGSENVTLKADADAGSVTLTIGDEAYHRKLSRAGRNVTFDGDPYLEDATAADLFAFLLASNETRRTVLAEGDLREIVMEPVDVEAIEREIEELRAELSAIEDERDRRNRLRERRDALETERTELSEELETVEAELATAREELEATDRDVGESRDRQQAAEAKLESLQDAKRERRTVETDLEAEQESLAEARDRLASVTEQLEDIDMPDADRDDLRGTREDLWDEREALETRIDRLRTLIEFNEELLSGDASLLEAIETSVDDDGDRAERLTSKLSSEAQLTCWTCGQPADSEQVAGTIDTLREYREELTAEHESLGERIASIEERLDRLEARRAERDRLRDRRDRAERDIERSEQAIESLQARRAELDEEIDELEAALEEIEPDEASDTVIELHKEVNEYELRRTDIQDRLDEIEDELVSVEAELSELSDLDDRESELEAEIRERRTRIDRLEEETVEAFNTHMDELVDRLTFENIERVWLERKQETQRAGRRTVERTVFELHVVRSGPDGTVFEDSLSTLSESERNVIALVFALAGYLAHEVYEDVPFMLLDSLEMIDASRTARLLEYFAAYPTYLVAVVLAEELDPTVAELDVDNVIEV